MSLQYNPPLTPGYNSTTGLMPITGSNLATTRNPFFNLATQFIPRNLHDVIRWVRFITTHSPVTTEVIRKLSTYPVTDFNIDTEKEALSTKYRDIIKSFKLKSALHDIGFDFHTLGNVFISLYFPIQRSLVCPHCKTPFPAKNASFVKFTNFQFEGECPKCSMKAVFAVKDIKSYSVQDMNLIKWDPVHIAVNHNPITNEYDYYYKIPNDVKRRVKQGDRLFVDSMPWELIDAVRKNQDFKFDNANFFHMKNISTGQMIEGVSVPPLISHFSLVFYMASLRRANEAIADDYMSPLRVVYPQAQSGNSDPVVSLSMRNFAGNMQAAFAKHKMDPNHIVIAPVPVGYEAISGEGKALLVSQEIMQAEESLLLSLGVSRELLTGTTNWTSSTVGLRMLENTLSSYCGQINDLIEWIITKVSGYLGIDYCDVSLTPFRLTDDDNLREVLIKMVSAGKASVSTLYETYGLNYDDELEQIREDAVAEAVNQVKAQMEIDRGVFLAAKSSAKGFDKDGDDYKEALMKAQSIAQQLTSMDHVSMTAVLNQLEIEDYALFILVTRIMERASSEAPATPESTEEQQVPEGGQEVASEKSDTSDAPKEPDTPTERKAGKTPKVKG